MALAGLDGHICGRSQSSCLGSACHVSGQRPFLQGPTSVGLVSVWLSFRLEFAVSVWNRLLGQLAHMWVSRLLSPIPFL